MSGNNLESSPIQEVIAIGQPQTDEQANNHARTVARTLGCQFIAIGEGTFPLHWQIANATAGSDTSTLDDTAASMMASDKAMRGTAGSSSSLMDEPEERTGPTIPNLYIGMSPYLSIYLSLSFYFLSLSPKGVI